MYGRFVVTQDPKYLSEKLPVDDPASKAKAVYLLQYKVCITGNLGIS